jgi:hypothetical protein
MEDSETFAAHRETETTDDRYAKAAANLLHLAMTMRDVPDDLLLDVSITSGLISKRSRAPARGVLRSSGL